MSAVYRPFRWRRDFCLSSAAPARQAPTISFLPDKEVFEKTWFKEDEIKSRLHETAYLNPELTIIYEDKRVTPEEQEVYHEPDGLAGFIRDLNRNKEALHDIVCFKGESEGITVEGAFQYVNEFHENVLGFCNNIYNAEGGTHITGFKSAFTSIMNAYAREIGILKEKDGNFTGADIRNGMTAVISIKHPDPRFEGQTKTKLDNQDAARATGKIVNEEVVRYFDKNLDTLKVVLSCAEKAAKIRKTEEKARTNLLTKQKFSFDSNGKLANCESRNADICEIFIVEGDSARRLCQNRQKPPFSGNPAYSRQDFECRKGQHRQDSCQCRDQDHDQCLRLWFFRRIRQRL